MMKIEIFTEGKTVTLRLPMFVGISSNIVKFANLNEFRHLGFRKKRKIKKAFRIYKKQHPDWHFIEVYSSDGTVVKINL